MSLAESDWCRPSLDFGLAGGVMVIVSIAAVLAFAATLGFRRLFILRERAKADVVFMALATLFFGVVASCPGSAERFERAIVSFEAHRVTSERSIFKTWA